MRSQSGECAVKSHQSLKTWRENQGLTQLQLAAAVGVHVQYISAIERGVRRPGMKVATALRNFTKGAISLDDLAPPMSEAA